MEGFEVIIDYYGDKFNLTINSSDTIKHLIEMITNRIDIDEKLLHFIFNGKTFSSIESEKTIRDIGILPFGTIYANQR